MSLSNAVDAIVGHMPVVSDLRKDPMVSALLKSFKKVRTNLDIDALLTELTDAGQDLSLDTSAFPLDSIGGISAARNGRFRLQAMRDRVTTISGSARKQVSVYRKIHRVGYLYVRQHPTVKVLTAKLADSVCDVALREIVEDIEDLKSVLAAAKETLSDIDAKSSTLESWFTLHKQYVFMLGKSRGPKDERETYDSASRTTANRRLGSRRNEVS